MEANLQRRIQRYGWDRAVPYYEDGWKTQLYPAQRLLLEMADLQPGEQVLETACGTGLVSIKAALAVGPAGKVTSTDLSDAMVAAATRRAASWNLPQITFLQSDAEQLRMPDDHFNAALCALGMMYFPDPVAALREQYRVLKKGGRAVAAVWGRRKACGWNAIFPIVDARVRTDVCPMFYQLGTGDNLAYAFKAAGYTGVGQERIATLLYYPSAEAALSAVFSGGPVAMAYARFDPATREEVHAAYLDSIEQYREGTAYHIPGEFVVAAGYKN